MYPRSFLCEEAKIKQHTSSRNELCTISQEEIWEYQFTFFFCSSNFKYCIDWGHIFFSKRHFIESSFCWNPIFPNHYFVEAKNGRKSFDRIVVQPNVIFPNRCSAECHFYESSFSRTSCSRNIICPNVILTNDVSGKKKFYWILIRLNDIRHYMVLAILLFGKTTIRWNDVSRKWCGPVLTSTPRLYILKYY